MNSPQKLKRSLSDIVNLKPVNFFKADSLKENIPPALSMDNHELSIEKQCQATPKKRVLNEDPVTPNANFKLLTSLAAALDYVNCSSPKSIKKEESCSNEAVILFDNRTCDDTEIVFNPISRKEKSLAIICTRFLDMYPLFPNLTKGTVVVSLDEVSAKLGIERRRLYDIVNVFESIEMLTKLAKNRYIWYGKNYLTNALQKLKNGAIKECILEKLQYVLEFEGNVLESKQSCILDEVRDFNQSFEHRKSSSKTPDILRHPSPLPELRKEKSLAIMSQKFLMLFLVSPTKIIGLGVAAKVLNGFQNSEKGAQVKTQIRRLYDIANVLSSIGLIQKEVTIGTNGRKPAFKYIGPDLDEKTGTPSKESQKQAPNSEPRLSKLKPKSLVRHSSFQEICAVAEMERSKICLNELPNSAPPFQKSFQNFDKTPEKTSFFNLKLSLNSEAKEVPCSSDKNISSHLKDLKNLPLLQKSKSEMLDVKIQKPQAPLRSISLPRQSSVKLINVPKQILAANGPYYILNPSTKEVVKSPTPMGTVLLISPLSANNPVKEVVQEKMPEKKVSEHRTLQLSSEQRDTILKSLNLSLSDGQIAAIQLEGSSVSPGSDVKSRCNLLKIIEKHEQNTTSSNGNNNPVKNKLIITVDIESNESSPYSTRNASPNSNSSRFDSPVSFSNGATTSLPLKGINNLSPSLNSCNSNSSNMEACEIVKEKKIQNSDSILKSFLLEQKSNENPSVSSDNLLTSNKSVNIQIGNKSFQVSIQQPTKGVKRKSEDISINSKNGLPLKENINLSPTTNSCSSDSLNMEVSEILNEKNARGSNSQFKSFLIDEKTILSPIKKHKGEVLAKPVTPTYFATPPYTDHDACFAFNNLPVSKQINAKDCSFPLLQKTNNGASSKDKIDFTGA